MKTNSRNVAAQTLLLAISLCAVPVFAAPPAGEYENPVLIGDYPDPSVVRVGKDYWATATSSEWGPLFPILHSRDLVNWKLVGHVFNDRPEWSTRNYWAPEITHYRGRFYVYYTGRTKDGPLCVAVATADKAEGPYTDHGPMVAQDAGSIDAVTVFDENNEYYMLWKEDGNSRKLPTPIWAQKLSEDGTKLVGARVELIRNDAPWEGQLVEGPFVVRRDGWFYLFYSGAGCCGRGCNYALGVARSKKLLGPYEKNPANPILNENNHWKCPGHGSIVTTPDNRDFLLYHAYDVKDFVYVGRQGLLDEVLWNDNGWPTINRGQGASSRAAAPSKKTAQKPVADFADVFSSRKLNASWQWPHAFKPEVEIKRGRLVLRSPADRKDDLIGGVLAQRTVAGDYTVTTEIDMTSVQPGVFVGLSAYGDQGNALGISISNDKAIVWRRQGGNHETVETMDVSKTKKAQLRMTASGGFQFQFAFSTDGKEWQSIGRSNGVEGQFLPPWDRGVRAALVVGGAEGASAGIEWFRMANQINSAGGEE